ncbi:MAG: M48 family metallopeptidase [Actinomycetota bacterium]|jgi:Zn-dependent protease with chaperone function|nr:M48 family metallopeptidase [Actinomycetota bacterium]
MTAIEPALKYPNISAQAFAHPADRAASAALRAVPMLDTVIKKLSELQSESRFRQLLLGNAVRLGEDQMPAAWAIQQRCASVLDIDRCPALYVTQQPVSQALTVGTHEPVTLVMSGLIADFEEDELTSVLAHEMGHVLADHVGLTTTLELTKRILTGVLRGQFLAGLPLRALYYALLEWSRMAELTADRASALVTADPLLPCRTLMRVAGGPVKGLNLDAFIRQATEYEEEASHFARYQRFWRDIGSTHPLPVRRVKELIGWVAAGDYDRIRSGAYVQRGQEPPPSEEFEAAFAHYKKRFSALVDRAGGGVQTAFDRISSWLDSRGEHEDDNGDADFEEDR